MKRCAAIPARQHDLRDECEQGGDDTDDEGSAGEPPYQ